MGFLQLWLVGATPCGVCGRLIAVASLIVWDLECWLSSCLRLVPQHVELLVPRHVEPFWTRQRILVPCIGRWILIHFATREVPKYIVRKILSMYSQYPIPDVFCIIQRINEPNLNSVTHRSPEFTFIKGSILNPSYVSCRVQTHLNFLFWRVESTLESTFILLS